MVTNRVRFALAPRRFHLVAAQRWERGVLPKSKKTLPRCPKCNEPMRAVEYATFNCIPCEITLSYGNHEDEDDR